MPPKSKTTTLRCNACPRSIKTAFNANLHPLLKVLVCRTCYLDYGTGDFSEFDDGVDENGDDNFCRLCVDGGELYFCANSNGTYRCHYGFCRECIGRINPQDPVVKEDLNDGESWKCLACEETKTAEARRQAQEALKRLNIEELERNVVGEEINGNAMKKRKDSSPEPLYNLEPLISQTKPKASSEIKLIGATSENQATKAPNSVTSSDKLESQNTSDSHSKKVDNSKQEKPAVPASPLIKQKPAHMSEKPVTTAEKQKAAKVDSTQQREPEAISIPPVEKPKPPKTSLRNLGPRTSLSSSMHSSTTASRDEGSNSNKPPRVASDTRPPLRQNQSIRSEAVTSKKLKVNKHTVESCILLSEPELKNRLREYQILKDNHLKRVGQNFDSIVEHFDTLLQSRGDDELMKSHIDNMRRSVHDLNNMFNDLEKLWSMRDKKV